MTVKELKEEAKKLGYIIAKKREYIKLVPCSECGNTRIIRWTELNRTQFYRCRVCGKSSAPRKYKYEAQEQWNLENK